MKALNSDTKRGAGILVGAIARKMLKKQTSRNRVVSAERIARLAGDGKSISIFFGNQGRMMKPMRQVEADIGRKKRRQDAGATK